MGGGIVFSCRSAVSAMPGDLRVDPLARPLEERRGRAVAGDGPRCDIVLACPARLGGFGPYIAFIVCAPGAGAERLFRNGADAVLQPQASAAVSRRLRGCQVPRYFSGNT